MATHCAAWPGCCLVLEPFACTQPRVCAFVCAFVYCSTAIFAVFHCFCKRSLRFHCFLLFFGQFIYLHATLLRINLQFASNGPPPLVIIKLLLIICGDYVKAAQVRPTIRCCMWWQQVCCALFRTIINICMARYICMHMSMCVQVFRHIDVHNRRQSQPRQQYAYLMLTYDSEKFLYNHKLITFY